MDRYEKLRQRVAELGDVAMLPHSADNRCVCTDGLAALRDVQSGCNSGFDAADVLRWLGEVES